MFIQEQETHSQDSQIFHECEISSNSYINANSVTTVAKKPYIKQTKEDSNQSSISHTLTPAFSWVKWLIENRLGASKIIGKELIPSQYIEHNICKKNMELLYSDPCTDKITISYEGIELDAVIHYPRKWKEADNSKCIVLHSPNTTTINYFFSRPSNLEDNADNVVNLENIPKELQTIIKTPIIMYDYRGTGINKNDTSPQPTANTIIKDGEAVLNYALKNFKKVDIAGISLGGGVATTSTRNLMSKQRIATNRIKVLVIDSFSTSSRVMLPQYPKLADTLGWILGGQINSEQATEELLNNNIKVVSFNHADDGIIPIGAQLYNFMKDQDISSAISSNKDTGHAVSDADLIRAIKFFNHLRYIE